MGLSVSAQKAHLPEVYTLLFRQWLYTILMALLPTQIAGRRTRETTAQQTCRERAPLQLTHRFVGQVSPNLRILSMAVTRINSVFLFLSTRRVNSLT